MKVLILFLILAGSSAFAKDCVNKNGEIAKIDGLTLTIRGADGSKVLKTATASKITRSPKCIRYTDVNWKPLFTKNFTGRMHQGGKVDVTGSYIKYKGSRYNCGK